MEENKVRLTLRTATRDRQADIAAPADATVEEILSAAMDRWHLPDDYEYVVRCERMGAQLAATQTLQTVGLQDGDVLEIQPLADAG